MHDLIEKFKVTRLEQGQLREFEDKIIREFPLEIVVNQKPLVKLVCSPVYLKQLAVGYLFSEGIIKQKDDIKSLTVEEQKVMLDIKADAVETFTTEHKLITSGCGKSTIFTDLSGSGLKKIRDNFRICTDIIFDAITHLSRQSQTFRETGAVHNALLAAPIEKNIMVMREDIGRHNTIDKIAGYMILQNIAAEGKMLVISGRVSSEMLLKTARSQIPIIVSRSAPTDMAVRLAYRLGITLIGFARGKRMNIYTHKERIEV